MGQIKNDMDSQAETSYNDSPIPDKCTGII